MEQYTELLLRNHSYQKNKRSGRKKRASILVIEPKTFARLSRPEAHHAPSLNCSEYRHFESELLEAMRYNSFISIIPRKCIYGQLYRIFNAVLLVLAVNTQLLPLKNLLAFATAERIHQAEQTTHFQRTDDTPASYSLQEVLIYQGCAD